MSTVFKDMMETPIIENTKMAMAYKDSQHIAYEIMAIPGYVLHDAVRDWFDEDPDTGEQEFHLGYTKTIASCGADYDFTETSELTVGETTYTAYGPRKFCAVAEGDLPT